MWEILKVKWVIFFPLPNVTLKQFNASLVVASCEVCVCLRVADL